MEKMKKLDIKIFIIPLLLITIIFIATGRMVFDSVREHYYHYLNQESVKLAQGYSHSLAKASEAREVVNQLLEERLIVAGDAVVLYDGQYNNELFARLANILKVDEIDYYEAGGKLIYSNLEELIGWEAYEGHPVYDFMKSNELSRIDHIRRDSITGNYYKYGYFKVSNGGLVQIGVRADKVYSFLDRFNIQQLLDEMKVGEEISLIYFMDNDFNIIGSSDTHMIGEKFKNEKVIPAILNNEVYSFVTEQNGKMIYEIFQPVYFEGKKIGTIAIVKSLNNAETIIKQLSVLGVVILTVIYCLVLFIMFSIYKVSGRLFRLAYYDSLTGLLNKHYLRELINEELKKKEDSKKAFLFINCRHFKLINLVYGYDYGDEILKALGERLKTVQDNNRILFRYSADRFVLFVKNYKKPEELISISKEITGLFNNSLVVQDIEQLLDIQVAMVEMDRYRYKDIDRVLKDASITLSYIKSNDSKKYAFFNEAMEKKLQREDLIEKEIRSIILNEDDKKMYLEFQPQFDLRSNKIVAFEALARMNIPTFGFVSSLEFINLAERKQLIVPLSNLILKKACDFLKDLTDKGIDSVKVAVNISGIQLLRDDFISNIMEIIKERGIDPSRLELEITESVFFDSYEVINERLKRLKENKIGIVLDDFGTGYSSFSRLRELHVDCLKIDKNFVVGISQKEEDEIITGDIISMAHKLGLLVVAEGVEQEEQKTYLMKHGCDIIQGYYYSKPLSKEEAIKLVFSKN